MPFSLLTVWKICGHWKVIFMLIKINVAFNFVSIPFNVSGNILFVLIKMASAGSTFSRFLYYICQKTNTGLLTLPMPCLGRWDRRGRLDAVLRVFQRKLTRALSEQQQRDRPEERTGNDDGAPCSAEQLRRPGSLEGTRTAMGSDAAEQVRCPQVRTTLGQIWCVRKKVIRCKGSFRIVNIYESVR